MKRAKSGKPAAKAHGRAKAAPKRRKRTTAIDRAQAEANALAALMADAPAVAGLTLSPPTFVTGPKMLAAWRVWSDLVPLLAERGLIEALDKHALAMLCVYAAEFVAANEDILKNGLTQAVATVAGGSMLRLNPAVDVRDHAGKMVLDLSARFGLTPLDRARLLKLRAGTDLGDDLFGKQPAAPVEPEVVDQAAREWSGLLDEPAGPPN